MTTAVNLDVPRGKGSRLLITLFAIGWLFSNIACATDVYWSIKTQDVLIETEENPVGRWLIHADDGSVALFMALKFLGTTIAMSVIPLLYLHKRWMGYSAMFTVSFVLSLLVFYLNQFPQ